MITDFAHLHLSTAQHQLAVHQAAVRGGSLRSLRPAACPAARPTSRRCAWVAVRAVAFAVTTATLLAAVGPAAHAGPRTPAPRVVIGAPQLLTDSRSDVDHCGRPATGTPVGNGVPTVTPAEDGLVVSWWRSHTTGSTGDAALVRGSRVQPLPQPDAVRCTDPDDGRLQYPPSVATDGTGRTYLASVLEVPDVPLVSQAAGAGTYTYTLQVATRDAGDAAFSTPVSVDAPIGFVPIAEVTADPFVPERMWLTYIEPVRSNIHGGILRVTSTTDGGQTWAEPTAVTIGLSALEAPFTPELVVVGRDHLVAVVTGGALGAVINQPAPASPSRPMDVLAYTSRDGGITWTAPARIMRVAGDRPDDQVTGNQLRFLPGVAATASDDGTIHVISDDYTVAGGAALRSASSIDGGTTWQQGPDVASTTGEGGFFAFDLAARPGGIVAAAYTRLDDTAHALASHSAIHVVPSSALRGGAGWGAPAALSPTGDRRHVRSGPFMLESVDLTATDRGFTAVVEHPVADAAGSDLQLLLTQVDVRL